MTWFDDEYQTCFKNFKHLLVNLAVTNINKFESFCQLHQFYATTVASWYDITMYTCAVE